MVDKKREYTAKEVKNLLRDFGVVLTDEEIIKLNTMTSDELNRFRKKKIDELFDKIEGR